MIKSASSFSSLVGAPKDVPLMAVFENGLYKIWMKSASEAPEAPTNDKNRDRYCHLRL